MAKYLVLTLLVFLDGNLIFELACPLKEVMNIVNFTLFILRGFGM